MRKIFHFESPRERYSCDAAIVGCFDNRFELGFRKFLKRNGIVNTDLIKIAGGAKTLASPKQESDRTFLLDQLRTSMRLHDTERVILMVHSDCGAYGGLDGGFGGDTHAEARTMKQELNCAADWLRRQIPGLRVDRYFVDFEGVWEPPDEVPA
jgi:carbonic anhydrase